MRLYLDTNVLLNIILEEHAFLSASKALLKKIESAQVRGFISLLTLMEITRVLQKRGWSQSRVTRILESIQQVELSMILPSEIELFHAFQLTQQKRLDVLDALHVGVALTSADVLVTRDQKLLRLRNLPVVVKTPEAILRTVKPRRSS